MRYSMIVYMTGAPTIVLGKAGQGVITGQQAAACCGTEAVCVLGVLARRVGGNSWCADAESCNIATCMFAVYQI